MFQGPNFVIAIIALSMGAWVLTTWIRARHGYPVDGEFGGTVHKTDQGTDRKIDLLADENGRLKDQIIRLEERVRVLERIATDSSARLDQEINALR